LAIYNSLIVTSHRIEILDIAMLFNMIDFVNGDLVQADWRYA